MGYQCRKKTFVYYGTIWCVVIDTDEGEVYAIMEN